MKNHLNYGFSMGKLFLYILVAIVVISGALFGILAINKSSQSKSALLYTNSILRSIKDGKASDIFDKNIKLEYSSGNNEYIDYLNWILWAESIAKPEAIIDNNKYTIENKRDNIVDIYGNSAKVTVTYSTNSELSVFFTVSPSNKSWIIRDYGIK